MCSEPKFSCPNLINFPGHITVLSSSQYLSLLEYNCLNYWFAVPLKPLNDTGDQRSRTVSSTRPSRWQVHNIMSSATQLAGASMGANHITWRNIFLLICFLFWDMISLCSLGWPQSWSPLASVPESWDYRYETPCLDWNNILGKI